jgi:preprotein translocase subunit SecG
MTDILLNVFYVLIAVAMIVLILLQRGAGAQAGSGFGAGASGTVFGARGSANFLSSATKWLAVVFFSLSLFMAYKASHGGVVAAPAAEDLGVMSNLPATKPAAPANSSLPAPAPVQPATQTPAPTGTATPGTAPATAPASSAPAATAPATTAPASSAPAPSPPEGSKGG